MAKKRSSRGNGGVNKSAAIREQFAALGNDAASKDVIAALAAQGIEVSSAHVANERARQAQKAQRAGMPNFGVRRRGRPAGSGASAATGSLEQTLMEAKRLADRVGGVDEAKKALDILARLQS